MARNSEQKKRKKARKKARKQDKVGMKRYEDVP